MAKHQDKAAFAQKECERLQRLKELDLVTLFPEQMVQKVTEALRAMMGASAALVTIVDESSQWTKAPSSAFELPPSIPRELSFCAHAILSGAPLVVEDTTKDERFFRNPLVTSAPRIRFYAGAPITIGNGFAAGSLCVVDTKPRAVTPAQIAQLEGLAAIVSALVEQQRLTSSHAELSSRLTLQKQLLDYASDVAKLGAWEIDPQQGKLVWSDGMYTIHELEQGTAISIEQLPNFYHPEDRLRAQDWIEHAKNMVIPCEFQARMVGAKGTAKIVRVLAQAERKNGELVRYYGIKQDVTERVQAEAGRKEALDHYRHIVELSPQVPWTADAFGNILEAGPRWVELTGMPLEEALGMGWLDAVHHEDLDRVKQAWDRSLQTGHAIDLEYRLRSREGPYRWVRGYAAPRRAEDGSIIKWYGSVEYIDEKKVAQAKLKDREEFLRSILDSSLDCIKVLDLEGHLLYMNEPGIRLNEIKDISALIGKHWADLWPQQQDAIHMAIQDALTGRTGKVCGHLTAPSGIERWWECSVTAICGDEGKPEKLLSVSRDVTETWLAQRQAYEASSTLSNVLEATTDAVMVLDAGWNVKFLNRNASGLEGPGGVLAPSTNIWDIFPDYIGSDFDQGYRLAMSTQQPVRFDARVQGTQAWIGVNAFPAPDSLSIFYRDITEEKTARERMEYLARHDSLTGLPNRLSFNEAITKAQSQKVPCAVMLLDMDSFKEVNDTLGHVVGDMLLQQVAARLKATSPPAVFLARLGGDEFAFLIHTDSVRDAEAVSASILSAFDRVFSIEEHKIRSVASLGIACLTDGAELTSLLQKADIALYRAKQAGGSTYRLYQPEMQASLLKRQTVKQELELAIEKGELQLYYQPLVRASDRRVQGYEALMRWFRAEGAVSPAEFIPIAEETGLIEKLGEWGLEEACRQAAAWPQELYVSVNVSPAQFKSEMLPLIVAKALCKSGLSAERLELEITEGVLLNDTDTNLQMLHALKGLGVRIALDDFGTGYSSLGYLRSFPFDRIKIDRSFIQEIGSSEQSEAIIRTIVMLGHSLNMHITSEGVEHEDQLEWLRKVGCDTVQGYLLARPAPASHLGLTETAVGTGMKCDCK